MALRDSWKQAGSGIGHAFQGLGKAFADTAKTGVKKLNDWVNEDDPQNAAPQNGNADANRVVDAEPTSDDKT